MKEKRLIVGILVTGLFFSPVTSFSGNLTNFGSLHAEEQLSGHSDPAKLKAKLVEIDERIRETPSAKLYAAKANVLVFMHKPAKALVAMDKSIQLAPNTGKYYAYRGLIHSALGDVNKTIKDIERAKSMGCSDSDYLGLLALAQSENQDFENALKNAELALIADPKDYSALHARGRVRKHQKDYKKALDDFTLALKQNGNLPELYKDRALVWEKLGNKKNALSDRTSAQKLRARSNK